MMFTGHQRKLDQTLTDDWEILLLQTHNAELLGVSSSLSGKTKSQAVTTTRVALIA
jgi:hypothetical protein